MTTMVTELYDALIAAGAPEDKARAAAVMSAESVATKADINRIERELLVLKWMSGLLLTGVASLILKSFFV